MAQRKREVFSESEWSMLISEYSLSGRQAQILKAIFRGQETKEIAAHLKISYHTARTYLDRLYDRFEAGSRTELILNIVAGFHARCAEARCPLRE